MGFKRFGKLAGNTSAAAVLASSTPANTLTPFVAQPDGAKFLAYGEGASSAAFNRIATALQENIEQLAGVLDTPALADTRIMALDTVSYGSAGTVDLASGTANVDLAAFSAGLVPVTWVYTGLHENRLGDFIKMYRQPASTQAGQQAYEEINPVTAAQMGAVIPITAAKDLTAWPIFLDPNDAPTSPAVQTYLHAVAGGFQSPHSLALFIPPIAAVASDLPPYGGVAISPLVSRWWNDGIAPTTYSWNDMYMRPGCFVHIKLGGVNNGLYRIARNTHNQTALSSDKAVLTRGGLHKVSVVSTAGFTAGRLLCWSSYPDNASIIIPLDEKPNFAYCVFVDNAVGQEALYLAEVGGEEDFPTYASGSIYGQKVDQTSGTYGTASALGDVGEVDYETSAGSSISLRVGTMLYDAADALLFSEVLAVIPAHYPVQFDVNVAAGATFTPCSPLGFTLNPTLRFTAGDITGGSYIVHCKTLTTVREKMTSYGANGRWQIVPNSSDKLDHSAFEAGQIRAFARGIKTGDETLTDRGLTSEYPAGPFSPPLQLAGESLWKLTLTSSAGTLEAKSLAVGYQFVIAVTGGLGNTKADLVHASGNVVVLDKISTDEWPISSRLHAENQLPIQINSTFTVTGTVYTVAAIDYAPYLLDNEDNVFVPEPGLNTVYNNLLSRNRLHRGSASVGTGGKQAFMRLTAGQPITAIVPLGGPHTAYMVYSADDDQILLEGDIGGTTQQIGAALGALTFKDDNTPTAIPLSDVAATALPAGSVSILDAFAKSSYLAIATLGDGSKVLTRHPTNVTDEATRTLVYPGGGWKFAHAGISASRIYFNPATASLFAGYSASTLADAIGNASAVFGYENKSNVHFAFLAGVRNKVEHENGTALGTYAATHTPAERAYCGNERFKDATDSVKEVVAVGDGVTDTFTFYLYKNVSATTCRLQWTYLNPGDTVGDIFDNGLGTFGPTLPDATIDYTTGAVTLVFPVPYVPKNGTNIVHEYITADSLIAESGLCGENVVHVTGTSIAGAQIELTPAGTAFYSMALAARATYFITGHIVGRPVDEALAGKPGTAFKFEAVVRTESRSGTYIAAGIDILAHGGSGALHGGTPVVKVAGEDFSPWPANDATGCLARIVLVDPVAGIPGGALGSVGELTVKVGGAADSWSWSCTLRYTYVSTQEQRYPGEGYS